MNEAKTIELKFSKVEAKMQSGVVVDDNNAVVEALQWVNFKDVDTGVEINFPWKMLQATIAEWNEIECSIKLGEQLARVEQKGNKDD